MAYITIANFNKIYQGFNPSVVISDEDIVSFMNGVELDVEYKELLKGIIPIKEKKALMALEYFLKNPHLVIDKQLVRLDWKDSYRYVHEYNPAYHRDSCCEKLLKDFEGVHIPDFIKEQGIEKINEFRKWYKENEYLIKEGKEDIFKLRLYAKYGIQSTIVENHRNSGVISMYNSLSEILSDLVDHIKRWQSTEECTDERVKCTYNAREFLKNQLLVEKELFFSNSFKNSKTKEEFAAIILRTTHEDKSYTEEMIPIDSSIGSFDMVDFKIMGNYLRIKEFANGKMRMTIVNESIYREIREIVKWYYIFKYNPNLSFEEEFLQQLGFSPCMNCHGTSLHLI